ncbi:putative inorganic phosphate cotransporter [Anticarsia gemmatalis]|uniref:putative inorganic phosphate cotransporter n=1 Tax=Anticarsia gemmatalis TaxID=129554 RepID=UPI003F770245
MKDKKEITDNAHGHQFKEAGWGYRHQQCIILFWVLTIAYSMRSCMGVSLVAMTDYNGKEENTTGLELNNTADFKPEGVLNALMLIPPYPTFNWNKKVQDTVIASFFWGYMLLQIPAGQLAHRFGARYLLTGAMTINCVVSILLPMATYYGGWYCTVVCRVAQGLSQACIVPGLHTSLGKWAPLHERGRLAAFVYGGQALGTVFGLPMTGFISASPMGWPGIFRFYGIMSGMMAFLIWFLVSDTPAKHPKISAAEKDYIEDDLGASEGKKKMPVPWMKILKHKGVYAIIVAHIGQTWGQLTLYSEVPAFMDKIMGVNIKANGLLTALPFLVMWFSNFFFSWFTDWLIVKNIMNVTNTRKFANSLGTIPAAIGLIALAYAPQDIYVVETILVLTCAFKISAHCGFQVNHIDISPNYAGTMMSLSNFISNIGSSISPIIIGFILTDVGDKYLWRQVFFLAAGFYLVTNLVYVIFGTSEKADWNDLPEEEKEDVEENVPMMEKAKQ